MSGDRLAQIKQRAKNATKGPWVPFVGEATNGQPTRGVGRYSSPAAEELDESIFEDRYALLVDVEFIAHSREDVDWLIAEVERLRAALRRQRQQFMGHPRPPAPNPLITARPGENDDD